MFVRFYKITSLNTEKVYIGSTRMTLENRLHFHEIDYKTFLENGIKNTQYSYLGKKQDKAREGREKYITSDEMQTYIDNHNKSIEGWNDTESIYDSRSKKDIQDCVKNAFAKFAKDGSRNQDDRAYVLSLLYSDLSLDDIAIKINRTYAATKVFISETKKKFIPYSRPCFELLKD